jgi:hypothetical protein
MSRTRKPNRSAKEKCAQLYTGNESNKDLGRVGEEMTGIRLGYNFKETVVSLERR